MEIVPVLREVWHDDGAGIGVVSIDMHSSTCTLHVTYLNWPDIGSQPEEWLVTDADSGEQLGALGGGGGGRSAGVPSRVSWRYKWRFGFTSTPQALQVRNAAGSIAETVALVPAPRRRSEMTFGPSDRSHPLGGLVDAVWASGLGVDCVPAEVVALDAEPFETDQGVMRPVVLERWRGCDVVRFRFDRDVQPSPARTWRRTADGRQEEGVPVGASSGPEGAWTSVAFPLGE